MKIEMEQSKDSYVPNSNKESCLMLWQTLAILIIHQKYLCQILAMVQKYFQSDKLYLFKDCTYHSIGKVKK